MSNVSNREICLYRWLGDVVSYDRYMWNKLLVQCGQSLGCLGNLEYMAEVLQRNPDILTREAMQEQSRRYQHAMTGNSCRAVIERRWT